VGIAYADSPFTFNALIMPDNDLDYEELTKELAKNFNTLADAVQILSDRNTILQYKLQYAHTEVSFS
jgi:hypothetical protein